MNTITLKPSRKFDISVEAEKISPDVFSNLTLNQIQSLPVWIGNCEMDLVDLFSIEVDKSPTSTEETAILLEGDFAKVKRIAEGMSAGSVEVVGSVGMHAGNSMTGGNLIIQGNADDWLGREMRGGKIVVSGNAGNYVGSGYPGEEYGMRGGEIEIAGAVGAYLGEHMNGGNITVGGDAGDFPGAANQGGTIFISGKAYLPGAEMTKGSITIRGMAVVLPSYQKIEMVNLNGIEYQKYLGDLVVNGKGELYVAGEQ
jgi:formylmethanofuran dehydrogenase subunit C